MPRRYVSIHIHGNNSGNIVVGDDNIVEQQINSVAGTDKETYFDAGGRLKQVREEIGLKGSEFVEKLGLSSERKYLSIESKTEEAPLSLLWKVHKLTGVTMEWLKHGKSPRYDVDYIDLNPIKDDLDRCAKLNPTEYFLTLNSKDLHVGLVAQIGDHRYQAFDTGVTLDFWNWVESHWAISRFYKFLKALSDPWHDIDGLLITPAEDKKLYSGETHFQDLSSGRRTDLVYDILDINETRLHLTSYKRRYGGDWMHRVHDEFKYYLELDKKTQREKGE